MVAVRLRGGWTLHEMIISLAMTGAIVALAVHAALEQMRFFRGVGEIAAVQAQLNDVTGIARAVLWAVSPVGGDILVAQDTALELRITLGSAVVCESSPGRVVIPIPIAGGNTLAAFAESPQPDDGVVALLDDSLGTTWLTVHVASAPVYAGSCTPYQATDGAWAIALREPLLIPAGTLLRFVRPFRLSLYHASDNRWYLGARDWNAVTQRFNTIQPVAGPLDAANATPDRSGLTFRYLDATGELLPAGADTRSVTAVEIVARGTSIRPARVAGLRTVSGERFADSAVVILALPNVR
jgi:hypothetical protein